MEKEIIVKTPIYFLSDFHLFSNTDAACDSLQRERIIVSFLDSISKDLVGVLHLVGDVFDFWFEYKMVVPKGAIRLLGKLASMSDQGWDLHFHIGNHDLWQKDYFAKVLNATIHFKPLEISYGGKSFFIAHGDGLGKGDTKYKIIKSILHAPLNKWLFSKLHPDLGLKIMRYFSLKSRLSHSDNDEMTDLSKEIIYQFANKHSQIYKYDYYIFGHRHLPSKLLMDNQVSHYVCLGDWLNFCTYAVFTSTDGLNLLKYKQ